MSGKIVMTSIRIGAPSLKQTFRRIDHYAAGLGVHLDDDLSDEGDPPFTRFRSNDKAILARAGLYLGYATDTQTVFPNHFSSDEVMVPVLARLERAHGIALDVERASESLGGLAPLYPLESNQEARAVGTRRLHDEPSTVFVEQARTRVEPMGVV